MFLRLALKVVTQNDGDFLDVIPLCINIAEVSYECLTK